MNRLRASYRSRIFHGIAVVTIAASTVGCGGEVSSVPRTPTSPAAPATPAPPRLMRLSPPIDAKDVTSATGASGAETSADGVVKVSFPRKDVEVSVDGYKMPPFMGLTSWVAFSPARAGVADAMIMGDLVLFEDEVSAVMSVLLENSLAVTALHNHFFYETPRVYFMHVGGEGTVAALGKAVRLAMETVGDLRKKAPKPATSFGAPAIPTRSSIDGAKIESALGAKGLAKDGMFKVTVGRRAKAACGCDIGKTMGVSTWAAFAGTDDVSVVDGDFAVAEDELQPVLKALRGAGIHVVAIHHHMSGESPRILFLHYWGNGKAAELATVLRRALDLTAVEK